MQSRRTNAGRNPLTGSAKNETCSSPAYQKRNQAETCTFADFGAETETETWSTCTAELPKQ